MNTQFDFLRARRVLLRRQHERAVAAVANDAHRPERERHLDLQVHTGAPAASAAIPQIRCSVGDEDEFRHAVSLCPFAWGGTKKRLALSLLPCNFLCLPRRFGDNRRQPSVFVDRGGSPGCHLHQNQTASHARCRCCSSSTPTLKLANASPPR